MELLYRDDSLVAVNKPEGLLVHRSDLDRHETRFALQMVRNMLGRRVYPVHRLDRPTSGVLLFALSPHDAERLAAAFIAGNVTKGYLAVVRGITGDDGVIDYPLAEVPDRFAGPKPPEVKERQLALTSYRRLAQGEIESAVGRYPTARYSLVAATPRTGRRHQLRRHFKHIHHPIVGDTTYGDGRHNRFFREALGCRRFLLHAASLSFPHPASGGEITVTAPLDLPFAAVVARFGWEEVIAAYQPVGQGEHCNHGKA